MFFICMHIASSILVVPPWIVHARLIFRHMIDRWWQERRTRISEKLRKLQALVPNMDKVCAIRVFFHVYTSPCLNFFVRQQSSGYWVGVQLMIFLICSSYKLMWQQTSTSDMLDLAVDHIKGLQSQLQV